MHVLLTNYFPLGTGGAESSTYLTAKALEKEGIEVSMASTEAYPGVETFVFKKFKKMPFFYFQHTYLAGFLKKVISENGIDVVHTQDRLTTVGGIKAAHESGIPVVSHFRDYWFACPLSTLLKRDFTICDSCTFKSLYTCVPRQRFPWEAYKLKNIRNVRSILNKADEKIAISSKVKERMRECGIDGSVRVVPNPVDADSFSKADGTVVREKYGLEGKPVIGFVGSLTYPKGVEILKKVITRILEKNDVNFLIVGEGNSEEELEMNLRDERVVFTGKVNFKRIPEYYAACDIVMVPSLWEEPFGRVAIESMAARKPVVASKIGGLADIIDDGRTGYLVGAQDASGWVKKIEMLLDSKDLREKMGNECYETIKKVYDCASISRTLIDIYKEMLDAR